VLVQEDLIARFRTACASDPALDAALTYGSFAQGVADAYSDIEFWFFFTELPASPPAWLAAVAPFDHVVVNEFGSHVVFFPGLIRGEFHFAAAADIASVKTWPARSAPAAEMVVVDRSGVLTAALTSLPAVPALPSTASDVATLCGRFANWLVLAHHVTMRGEELRAQDAMSHVRRHLLWMVRLADGRTANWLTPSRRAELDLPADLVADVGSADLAVLWRCGREHWSRLATEFSFDLPDVLFAEIDARLA
jgi:lincosamide nucleotidyltransferase